LVVVVAAVVAVVVVVVAVGVVVQNQASSPLSFFPSGGMYVRATGTRTVLLVGITMRTRPQQVGVVVVVAVVVVELVC
jgi:hypothetical protein